MEVRIEVATLRDARTVLLVEGASDLVAVQTLAQRRGRDLAGEGVRVLAMGGATNIGHYLEQLGPRGRGLRLAGLYDVAEEGFVRRGLERAGLGTAPLAELGFHVCVRDLEDELIRALGTDGMQEVLAAEGDLRSFRLFQRQPAQQGRELPAQLRRFIGTRPAARRRTPDCWCRRSTWSACRVRWTRCSRRWRRRAGRHQLGSVEPVSRPPKR
ncbi:ATP-dependent endonuclease [Micromonospora fiedleri]|uniref:ATP-dependent endonuclease n=1 Tax=Micromonospora fiedleri TaxID=1157498 RepID=A0ABS1UPJ1_9ACTN|nr:TOPRIM nucleotidyl transferase/hydrolase domain-containing protein [Micromonospora fiedleri]MBL6277251.1 ATP-dependent endonuclease [Micromonospora fiedleri]